MRRREKYGRLSEADRLEIGDRIRPRMGPIGPREPRRATISPPDGVWCIPETPGGGVLSIWSSLLPRISSTRPHLRSMKVRKTRQEGERSELSPYRSTEPARLASASTSVLTGPNSPESPTRIRTEV